MLNLPYAILLYYFIFIIGHSLLIVITTIMRKEGYTYKGIIKREWSNVYTYKDLILFTLQMPATFIFVPMFFYTAEVYKFIGSILSRTITKKGR